MSTAVAINDESLEQKIDSCYVRISGFQAEIDNYKIELKSVDDDLENISDERQRYELLTGICDNLEKLDEIGGNNLFWSGLVNEDQIGDQLARIRDQVSFFERRINKVTSRRDAILAKINDREIEIGYLEEEIDYLKERQEEAKNEYVIEREIKPIPYRVVVMPWTKQGRDEKDFRKILLWALLICILLGVLIPLYNIPIPDRTKVVEIPERLAKLVKKHVPKPKPKPKPQEIKPEELKKADKKPTKQEREKARKKVKSKGVLAFKNNFADLLDDASLDKLGKNANLSNAGSTAKRSTRKIITSKATSSSGGINSASLSQNVAGTGDKISAVAFSRVSSDIGTAVGDDRPLSDGPGPSRTDEEIQIVFDRYKATLYRIYNRELRVNPTLQGKVVLRITIQPNGSVSLAKVESSDMKAKKMLDKIVARVKRFNFGAKEGVPTVTILYPIDFLPAS